MRRASQSGPDGRGRAGKRSAGRGAARAGLHLFALVVRAPRLRVVGLATRVRFVDVARGLVAAVEPVRADAGDEAALRAHDRVVRALCGGAEGVLPARFAGAVADEAALREALAPRAAELRARLAAVRGREQMTLRVLAVRNAAAARPTPGAPGRSFLEARRDALRLPALDPLRRAVAALVHEERVEAHGARLPIAASVHHLVARGASERYREIVDALVASGGAPPLAVRGPFPAYAFATEDAG